MKRLNQHIVFIVASALALATTWLTSCQDEIYLPDDTPVEEAEAVRFLSVKVRSTADESLDGVDSPYKDGNDYEHAIDFRGNSENVIIYFDREYVYKGYSPLEFDKLSVEGTTSSGEAEEVAFIGFMKPKIDDFYTLPEYGLLILNGYGVRSQLDRLNERDESVYITEVLQLTDSPAPGHVPGRNGDFMTMTSSAYLVNRDGQWVHSILFNIDKTRVFTSRTQAIMQPAAEAYVERMASKFTIRFPGGTDRDGVVNFIPDNGRAQVITCHYVNGEPTYDNRTWTLSVEGWGINKTEGGQYFFRNILPPDMMIGEYPYSFGTDINSAGEPYFYGWNRPKDHRSFWAVDQHYDSGTYPGQYRPAVDNPSAEYFGKTAPPSLGYISYNDLDTEMHGLKEGGGACLYSGENTFPGERVSGIWQHAIAGTEIVVGARIHIKDVDEGKADYDLYRNRIGVFYPSKTDFASYFISTFNQQLQSQSTMSYRYYDWSDPKNNGEPVFHTQAIPYGDYRLYYKDAPLTPAVMAALAANTMPANVENGDGKVIPWVEGMYIGRRDKDPNTYEEVGEIQRLSIQPNDFKSLIYDWIGAFDHFNQGRMIYTTPVVYRAASDKALSESYRPTLGDFGVPRNAWYSIAVKDINSIGTPVDDLNQPIIPYEISLENSIMMEINVLDWHEFSTDVTFPTIN